MTDNMHACMLYGITNDYKQVYVYVFKLAMHAYTCTYTCNVNIYIHSLIYPQINCNIQIETENKI